MTNISDLTDLVTLAHNDANTVILKIKKDTKFELLSLGCFHGSEDMFILSKRSRRRDDLGYQIIHKGGGNCSWVRGQLVCEDLHVASRLIYDTVVFDFGIPVDDEPELLQQFNSIQSLEEDLKTPHIFEFAGFSADSMILRKNKAFMGGMTLDNMLDYLEGRYKIVSDVHSKSPRTGCDVYTITTEGKGGE